MSGKAFDQSNTAGSFGADPEVQGVLEEYAAALSDGKPIARDRILAAHPEQASRLVEALDALDQLHAVLPAIRPQVDRGDATAQVPLDGMADFRIIRELGRGGMGIVYEAEQRSLNRRVALKVLPFAAAIDPRSLARFRQESQAAAQLDHPHIVRVYGVGCDRGVHYYAMQHIDGQSLAQVIAQMRARERGPNPAPREGTRDTLAPGACDLSTERTTNRAEYYRAVARVGMQVSQALDYAHTHGILHRDIKPGNLLLDATGSVWITDFGLARIENETNLTLTGDVLGTLRYMSPEQARARRGLVDQRTDIYSLGATLYELLTLDPAFPAEDRADLLRHIAHDDPRPLRQVDRSIPAEFETIVSKTLEKDPADRYLTAQDLALDLQRYLDDQPLSAHRATPLDRLLKWSRRHRPLVASLAVSLALLLVGMAIVAVAYAWNQEEIAADRAQLVRDTNDLQKQTTVNLYRALVGKADALRIARAPNYRDEVWKNLQQAMTLDVPHKDLDAVKTLALACLGDPFGQGPVDFDSSARPLTREVPAHFQALLAKIGRPRTGPIHAISDDSKWLALARNGIELIDDAGNRQSAASRLGTIHGLEFSPSARFLAAACEEGAVVWSVPELVPELVVRGDVIRSVAFHPTGQLLAMLNREHRVELWSLASHRLVHGLTAPPGTTRIEITSDGDRLLALAGEAVAEGHNITSTPEKRYLLGHTGAVTGVEFSPDGEAVVSIAKDRTLRLWDAMSGRLHQILSGGHRLELQDVAISPDGSIVASGDWEGTINLWEFKTGQLVARIDAHDMPGQIWRLRFAPHGGYLAAAGSAGFAAWSIATPAQLTAPMRLCAVPRPKLFDLAIHPDGKEMAVLDGSGHVFAYRLERDEPPNQLQISSNVHFPSLSFDPAGSLMTYVRQDQAVALWDWERESTARVTAHKFTGTTVVRLARTQDGRRLAVAAPANQIVIYDLATDRELVRLPREAAEIWALTWNQDGTRLAIGLSDGTVAIWNLAQVRSALHELGIELPELITTGAVRSTLPSIPGEDLSKMIAARMRQQLTELLEQTNSAFRTAHFSTVYQGACRAIKLAGQWRASASLTPDLQIELVRNLNDLGFRFANMPVQAFAERIFRAAIETAECQALAPVMGPELNGHRVRSYLGLAMCLEIRKQPAAAVELYRRALEILSSRDADSGLQNEIHNLRMTDCFGLGRALVAAGQIVEAERVLREGIEVWDEFAGEYSGRPPDPRINAGFLLSSLYSRGHPAEAERQLQVILRYRPNDAQAGNRLAWLLAGGSCQVDRRPAEAARWAQKAVEAAPQVGAYWHTLGVAYFRNGQWEQALSALRAARGRNRSQSFGHDGFFLAMCEWSLGHTAQASKWYEASCHWRERFAATDDELAGLQREAARMLDLTETGAEARPGQSGDDDLSLFSEIIAADPEAGWAHLQRAGRHIEKNCRSDALADLQRAAELPGMTAADWRALARGYQKLACWGDAIAALERSLEAAPLAQDALNELAWILATCPDPDLRDGRRSVELATQATAMNPSSGSYWNTLGVAQYRLGNWSSAQVALMNSLGLLHEFAFAQNGYFLALVADKSGNRQLADTWYAAASSWKARFADDDEETDRFGHEAAQALEIVESPRQVAPADPARADVEVFNLIDAAHPHAAWVLVKRARCHLARQDREKAIADLAAALNSAGDDLLVRLEISGICSELADWNTMINALRELPAHRPEYLPLVAFRVRAWLELGQWNQALGDLAGLTESNPDDDNLLICQALVHLAAKNEDSFRRLRRELFARTVAAPVPQETIPILEALLTVPVDDFDVARLTAVAQRAATNCPENFRVAGCALYRSRQFAAAVESFARATPPATKSRQARDHFFLAMAHQRLDHVDQAQEHLRLGVEALSAFVTPAAYDSETVLSEWSERLGLEHLRHEAELIIQN